MADVRIWEQKVSIPTYGVGKKEKNPMFFEKRVYQGSSGKVYPLPVVDKIEDEKKEQPYQIVFLENAYIQVQVMPELGGRIYRALDKTNGYDFVYYNRVIKPALVGLTGPWVSGGIEFNWPQHHRPTTFEPIEYSIDDSKKGEKTVWMSDHDRLYGTKVTTGITLRSDSAVIEITSELYNPTGEPQTFLWWANPAVSVHDETQSIFPPDVHAVMDHGKRDVSGFPIATGTYYKMDYSAGVDISRYKNIPVPTSYMAYHSDYDFVGGYDYRAQAGVLHVADHHISPGKKQWTWGNGDFGKAWDRNLTDEDGPYIELMTGVFTDNQPDFTWLAPYSGKRFTQYFLPYKQVAEVKCASKDLIMGLTVREGQAKVTVYASLPLAGVSISLAGAEGQYLQTTENLSPTRIFEVTLTVSEPAHKLLLTAEAEGTKTLRYRSSAPKLEQLPDPARAIPEPEELDSNEALLLAGLHLEQYRHATFEADKYYREALKRDRGDLRVNNAYGNLLLRRGEFERALELFETAKKTATTHSPNPYDGEVFFNLGKAYEYLGREEEAFDAYFKSVWSDAWKTQGYLKLSQIASRRGTYADALEYAEEALLSGAKNFKARAALAIVCRKTEQRERAFSCVNQTLLYDPLDVVGLREKALLTGADEDHRLLASVLRGDAHHYLFLAQSYAELGYYRDAVDIIGEYLALSAQPYAMVYYFRAYWLDRLDSGDALDAWEKAAQAAPDYCFPNMAEDYMVLQAAILRHPSDARAYYYLGCFLYDKRRHADACAMWERSRELDDSFPTVLRNLSLYYANKEKNWEKARGLLAQAFALNTADARVFYELCELYRRTGVSLEEQRAHMEEHYPLVESRDDLMVAYLEVLNGLGMHQRVLDIIMTRHFHPWEGGEGKVPTQHIEARIGLAKRLLREGKPAEAREHLGRATIYFDNFGEGKLAGAQENQIDYYRGLACRVMGEQAEAEQCFRKASSGLSEPAGAMYYNDQPPHTIYYQGLALAELGEENASRARFNKLLAFGQKHLFEKQRMDYFAVSMPDFMVFETDLDDKNRTHCYYMIGLGSMGLGRREEAREAFTEALRITPNHYGAASHLSEL